jgi:hypothetical protein
MPGVNDAETMAPSGNGLPVRSGRANVLCSKRSRSASVMRASSAAARSSGDLELGCAAAGEVAATDAVTSIAAIRTQKDAVMSGPPYTLRDRANADRPLCPQRRESGKTT